MKPSSERGKARGTLGTFAGVFTPSILTILGIILFLRLGFVVGAAGLKRALLIIVLANVISILTSISLSAIATNLRVKGGGDYYLISRTLGVEYGGALGIVLFLAQSVSIAFYAIGFGEAVAAIVGLGGEWTPQILAIAAVVGLFVLAWLGADWATRFQYGVMVLLFAAIVGFFLGGLPKWDPGQLRANLEPAGDLGFWVIFAIFFPAVTGFTQGVSMPGDLKDPGRSLPRGTFLAVGLSFVIYLAVAVVFAAVLPGADLVRDYGAMQRVSSVGWLVSAGVIAATLSSALASFLGAPRILQSLSGDHVFPFLGYFAKGHGATHNPRRATILSGALAVGTILMGDLNVVAPVVPGRDAGHQPAGRRGGDGGAVRAPPVPVPQRPGGTLGRQRSLPSVPARARGSPRDLRRSRAPSVLAAGIAGVLRRDRAPRASPALLVVDRGRQRFHHRGAHSAG